MCARLGSATTEQLLEVSFDLEGPLQPAASLKSEWRILQAGVAGEPRGHPR